MSSSFGPARRFAGLLRTDGGRRLAKILAAGGRRHGRLLVLRVRIADAGGHRSCREEEGGEAKDMTALRGTSNLWRRSLWHIFSFKTN